MSIAEIVRKNLRQSELYQETQQVRVYQTPNSTHIDYYPRGQEVTYSENWPAQVEIQITGKTCRLLRIAIDEQHRGKGHGKQLYQIIENIAKELGCTKIEMEPSGTTHTGETREHCLLRNGYIKNGTMVEKELVN